jgi:hypothetical protein
MARKSQSAAKTADAQGEPATEAAGARDEADATLEEDEAEDAA